jgi:Kdo2-lipid IVA lauroyltransferase/acyltransferase
LRIRRAHVVQSMARAGVADPNRAASAMYRALGISAVEFLFLGADRHSNARADIEGASRDSLAAARSLGRGVVIAASHTGNWDLAACAIAKQLPLLVVTKRLKIRWIDAFWQNTRARLGVRLCEAAGAMSVARAQLAADGAVAMMIDQVPNKRSHAAEISFLGEPAFVDRAPATLAARSHAPLVVSAARRLKDGSHQLAVLDVIVPPERAGKAWIEDATLRATKALEKFVIENPSEWLWMHRRWRAPLS